jgi:photosystem II stability/assembly factor-like uncharacterized protein
MKTEWEALFVFVLLAAGSLNGQWVPTNGPYCGGNVNFLYASGNKILAGVSAPFVSKPNLVPSEIFESTDYGENWIPVFVAGKETIFTSVAVAGLDLFVSSTTGIFKSTDNGRSWFEPDTSLGKVGFRSLAVISQSGEITLFASTAENRIIVSNDHGKGWDQINLAVDDIKSLATCQNSLFASADSGLYISTDRGVNWRRIELSSPWIGRLTVMEDSILFVGTVKGVFYSTDQGNKWIATSLVTKTEMSGDVITTSIPSLLGISDSDLFAYYHDDKLFVSGDKGMTWIPLGIYFRSNSAFCKVGNYLFLGTEDKGIDRFTEFEKKQRGINMEFVARGGKLCNNGLMKAGIFHLAASGGVLYAGTKMHGVFRSTDGGKTWNFLVGSRDHNDYVTALEVHDSSVVARTWNTLSISSDNGLRWTGSEIEGRQGRGFAASLAVHGTDIFAGTEWGLLHSTNSGTTWTWSDSGMSLSSGRSQLPGPFSNMSPNQLSAKRILPVPPPRKSMISKTLREVQALIFKGSKIFAGVTGGDIFVSTDDGIYWTRVDSNLTKNFFNAFTVMDSDLFALTEGDGVFRSSDDGKTWKQINEGVTDQDAHVLVRDGKNLFLGAGNGVYLSVDKGDHWMQANEGLKDSTLKDPIIIGLTVSDGYLYAGTWDYGVWKRSISEIIESSNHLDNEKQN